jgi:hypothetical protein
MAPNARERELLYEHDQGLARARRMIKRKAEDQLKTLVAVE